MRWKLRAWLDEVRRRWRARHETSEPPKPRRTPWTPPTLERVDSQEDLQKLLAGLRVALDVSIRDRPLEGYYCTQVLNQLHRALMRDPIDVAEVCGVLGVPR